MPTPPLLLSWRIPLNRFRFRRLKDLWYIFSPFLTATDWMVVGYVRDSISPLDEERLLLEDVED